MKFCLRIFFTVFFIYNTLNIYAQDEPQFTQYMLNPFILNPAAAGYENAVINTLQARSQWVNINGAPQTQSLSSNFPLFRISGGAGVKIMNDVAGQQRTTSASLSYAFRKEFKKSSLSFGAYGGIVQRSIDGSKLVAPQGSYEDQIDHNDNYIPVALVTDIIPDAGAGVFYNSNKLVAGISASHLLNNTFQFETPSANATIQYSPDVFVYGGYKISLGENFALFPNVLYKTDLAESMVDVNSIVNYKNNIFLGASFRSYLNEQTDAVALIAGWNISDRFGISYSYDITLSALNTVSAGSHEIVLNYRIPVTRPRVGKEINNFRYLYY